jgi:hypothetical protein
VSGIVTKAPVRAPDDEWNRYMKATRIRAVEMVRRIRDRHARILKGKTTGEIIAFYRAAGEAAMRTRGTAPSPAAGKLANPRLRPSS